MDLAGIAAIRTQAVEEHNRGHAATALRLLVRAQRQLAAAGDGTGRDEQALSVALWITRAKPEAEVHGVERGMACLDEARRMADRLGDPALTVRIHSQCAVIAMRSGRTELALAELAAAEQLIEHADRNDRFAILLNAGSLRLFRGELAGTRRRLSGALDFARAENMPEWAFKAAHNLAYAEFLGGNLPRALDLMGEANRLEVEVSRAVGLLDTARVLAEAGLVREADETLAAAGELFRADRVAQDLADCELERARCALLGGDIAAARRFAATARRRYRRHGNDQGRRAAELVLLQGDLSAGRPGSRLVGPALRLQRELADEGLTLVARTAAMIAAEAQLQIGQAAEAAETLATLGRVRATDPISTRLQSHYVHARVDAARGRQDAAARRVHRAFGELARYQASFGSIDMRTAAAVHGRRLAELDIVLALDGGRPAAVFAAAERARAVSSRLAAVRPPEDPVAAELLTELRQTVETLRAVEQDRAASAPLHQRRRDLERRIMARSWTIEGTGEAMRAAGLAEVRASLVERGENLVMYVQAGGRLSAVTVADRVHRHDLGPAAPVIELVQRARADLDVLAQPALPTPLRAAVRASLERSAAGLEAALVAPLRTAIDRPLVIVSTGVLGQLPWASLPSLRGRPLVVAPSATKWLTSAQRRDSDRTDVVALAGPDLARGAPEAEAVAASWHTSDLLTGPAATRAGFAAAMGSASILHVAAHGVHQPENPLFSSLRLVDGPVFAHELDQHELAPEHVVLSACEVGLATVRPGDEALGLASVLLQLGTRSVIASVARVSDAVAEQTMAGYHAALSAGADSAAALAAAVAGVDSDVTPPFVAFGAAWRG
ncbi:MAG TPA: CHAT domain-containing protein [Jatrophihabitans sp.]|uniref:CHAT domain-containing protein n=1 Tax=Jatrophihabitans sp. TaxID=1932789 RepID=UPI002E03DBB2|nr:CHAT domain-containing protein [Jatrophihabitans sp.]